MRQFDWFKLVPSRIQRSKLSCKCAKLWCSILCIVLVVLDPDRRMVHAEVHHECMSSSWAFLDSLLLRHGHGTLAITLNSSTDGHIILKPL